MNVALKSSLKQDKSSYRNSLKLGSLKKSVCSKQHERGLVKKKTKKDTQKKSTKRRKPKKK